MSQFVKATGEALKSDLCSMFKLWHGDRVLTPLLILTSGGPSYIQGYSVEYPNFFGKKICRYNVYMYMYWKEEKK
jgi:hypothetical protein